VKRLKQSQRDLNLFFLSAVNGLLYFAETNSLNVGFQEGLQEGGAHQRLELFLVAPHDPVKFLAVARSRMEIEFSHSRRKVLENVENQLGLHAPTVIHAEDEIIRAHPGLFEPPLQEGQPG
jgi:hypothetical protein